MNLSLREYNRIRDGLQDTRGYYNRCFAHACALFQSGHSLNEAIERARKKYGF